MSEDGGAWVTHTHTHTHTHFAVLEMRGPPPSSVRSGGELGISSKTPAAFPEDIIRVSNSLQTLQVLLLCVYVCQYLCAHTSMVWLSSQNWGQIALRCRYFGIRWFFFTALRSVSNPPPTLSLTPHPFLPPPLLLYPSRRISSFPAPLLPSYPFTSLPRAPLFIPSRSLSASVSFWKDSPL